MYHAFVLPAGQSQPLTKREALVYAEIVAALAGASPPVTVANGDGTFTHTVQFEKDTKAHRLEI